MQSGYMLHYGSLTIIRQLLDLGDVQDNGNTLR